MTDPAFTRTETWPGLLNDLLAGVDLGRERARWAMDHTMAGEATAVELAGFLVALRAKGETAEEVAGLVEGMLAQARRIDLVADAVDTCGTGGDRLNTVNVSTMAALVVAAAGVPVVKHGNRAASSACGSADLLEALDVRVDLSPAAVQDCLDQLGIGFCFAPLFHPAMRHAAVTRRELGVRTAFNVLGPLCNPAQPAAQALGCADRRLAPVVAEVLARRGTRGLVFRGEDGQDELSTSAPSIVWVVAGGEVVEQRLDATSLGLPAADPGELRGGDAGFNAGVTRRFLDGEPGAVRDAVLLNAAAALLAAKGPDPTADVAEQLSPHLEQAAAAVDTGAAGSLLSRWVQVSAALR